MLSHRLSSFGVIEFLLIQSVSVDFSPLDFYEFRANKEILILGRLEVVSVQVELEGLVIVYSVDSVGLS